MAATRIVIVGGVAGGATAAARARRISEEADIVVFERGPYVSFANCGLPYYVGGEIAQRDKLLLQTPEALRQRYNIDVHVRTEVVAIHRDAHEVEVRELETGKTYRQPYDKLILSPGASPVRPPLPGIDDDRIYTLRTVPDVDRIKEAVDAGAKSAVVVGAGFIGLEMAENLERRGMEVHVVEMLDQVMPPLDREMVTPVHETLARNGVHLHLSSAVQAFERSGDRIVAKLASGAKLEADLVVLSIGVKPESSLAASAGLELTERGAIVVDESMRTSDPDIFAAGDAVAIRDAVTGQPAVIPLAGPANRQGRIAADNALGRQSTFRGTQGTSVVRVFDLTVASTGANEKTLKRCGVDYEKVYIHPAHHVGYFPGAEQMTVKLLFGRTDGRVLGAQIVGGRGADKRIDVLAMAIQANMTVYDLEEVELAYAPQFGAAKDPVNMAGFVAANVLRGDVELAHADSIGDATLLDVRSPSENAAGAIPNSVLIPLPELRKRHGELDKSKPVLAYCQVGMRGYLAARVLKQLGYKVANLSGGYKTYRLYHPQATPTAPRKSGASTAEATSGCGSGSSCGEKAAADDSESSKHAKGTGPPDKRLDACNQCCPGPIVAVAQTIESMTAGQVLEVAATDSGFARDIEAWCSSTGHCLIRTERRDGAFVARIRKAVAAAAPAVHVADRSKDKTILLFSNDLDRVMAALIIANGAAAMGQKVTIFFTFWGLNVLRRSEHVPVRKTMLERMFGWMMPRGAGKLALSKMHMAGMGTAMMRHAMGSKNVATATQLLTQARSAGVRLIACTMSLDVMGIRREELIDGVEVGGVAAYLQFVDSAGTNLFV